MNSEKKEWYKCPKCGKKLVKYQKNAKSNGVFLICKKCGKEIEIKLENKSLN